MIGLLGQYEEQCSEVDTCMANMKHVIGEVDISCA